MKTRRTLPIIALMALLTLRPESVFACAACYGQSDSPMASGMTWAIIFLGVIIFSVLAGVVAFFVRTIRRSAVEMETAVAAEMMTKQI